MGKIFDGRLVLPFVGIADQDEQSASKEEEGLYVSPSVRGYVIYNPMMDHFTISWDSVYNYTTHLNYGGRGLELSDLKIFDGKLLAVDDKTGVIFRLTKKLAIPWVIQPDGDGFDNKTFKSEWMTIKNDELYVGGYLKEYTTPDGNFLNDKPLSSTVSAT
ncbi:Apyrase [Aphelenchoides fujianensis]|nr:Apyrase [Aphelenchoides fujianensis]